MKGSGRERVSLRASKGSESHRDARERAVAELGTVVPGLADGAVRTHLE